MDELFSQKKLPPLLIFDLGGIMLPIRAERTIQAFSALGVTDINRHVTASHATGGIFHQYELGQISTPDFIAELRRQTGVTASDRQIASAWNAMIMPFAPDRLSLTRKLMESHRVVLLSNTNQMHIEYAERLLAEADGGNKQATKIESYFHCVYYSHTIHASKPSPEAFRYVLRAEGFAPSDAMFFDDSPANIQGAQSVGINAVLVKAL